MPAVYWYTASIELALKGITPVWTFELFELDSLAMN